MPLAPTRRDAEGAAGYKEAPRSDGTGNLSARVKTGKRTQLNPGSAGLQPGPALRKRTPTRGLPPEGLPRPHIWGRRSTRLGRLETAAVIIGKTTHCEMQGYGVGMLILNADGGCWPNPGPATYAFIAKKDGVEVHRSVGMIESATNNIAEWRGALAALNYAIGYTIAYPMEEIELRMDSQLVVHQLNGRWRVKNEGLKPLAAEGQRLLTALREQGVRPIVRWIPRAQNTEADALT